MCAPFKQPQRNTTKNHMDLNSHDMFVVFGWDVLLWANFQVDSELLNHLFALWDSRPENQSAPFHAPGSRYSAIVGSELFRSFWVLRGVCDIGFYNIQSRNGQNIYTLYHISIIILAYSLRCQLMKPLDGSWDISMTVPLSLQKRRFESYEIPRIRCYKQDIKTRVRTC